MDLTNVTVKFSHTPKGFVYERWIRPGGAVDWNHPVFFPPVTPYTDDSVMDINVALVVFTRFFDKDCLLMEKTKRGYTLPTAICTFDHYSLEQTFTRRLEEILWKDTMFVPTKQLAAVLHHVSEDKFTMNIVLAASIFAAPVMKPYKYVPLEKIKTVDLEPTFEDFFPSPSFTNAAIAYQQVGPKEVQYPLRHKAHALFVDETRQVSISLHDTHGFPGAPEYFTCETALNSGASAGIRVAVLLQALTPKRSFLLRKQKVGGYTLPVGGTVIDDKSMTLDESAISLANALNPNVHFNYSLTQLAIMVSSEGGQRFVTVVYKARILYCKPHKGHDWVSLDALRWDEALERTGALRGIVNSSAFHFFATEKFV